MDINKLSIDDIEGVKRQDEYFVTKIYSSFYKRLYFILQHYYINRLDVEGLVNEAFMRAFDKIEQFDHNQSFLPWLAQIGKNIALNELRNHRETLIDDQATKTKMNAIFDDYSSEISEDIMVILLPIEREFLIKYYVEGYTLLEISKINNFSLSSVNRLHRKIVNKLRKELRNG